MDPFWEQCLGRFSSELPASQFNTWIKPLRLEARGDALHLLAPNRFVLQWIKDRFLSRIETMGAEYFDRPVQFVLTLEEKVAVNGIEVPETIPVPRTTIPKEEAHRLNSAFTFSN